MKRREFVKTLGAAAAGLATAGCHRKSIPSQDRPPNLLVIVTDDQRHDTLGCAGHPIIHTPNMDGLAERGEVFCEHLWDHPDIPQTECLRADGWKYIRYPQHPEFEELYELTSDPHESRNLAGDPARGGILNDYRQRCRERADKAGRAGERM